MWSLFYDDYVDCHYEAAIQVFVDHCTVTDDACDLKHIFENLKNNIFNFITVLTTIADLSEQTYLDNIKYSEICLQLGKDVSELIRLVVGIRHSRFKHGHKYHDHNEDFEDFD